MRSKLQKQEQETSSETSILLCLPCEQKKSPGPVVCWLLTPRLLYGGIQDEIIWRALKQKQMRFSCVSRGCFSDHAIQRGGSLRLAFFV